MVTAIGVAAICSGSIAYAGHVLVDKLESKYLSTLDEWVEQGGKAQEYQSEVVESCGKLILASATISEVLSLSTIQREEFDFRVKVCAKTTVRKVYRQSELNDRELVQEICDNTAIPVLGRLCRRSGLR